MSSPEEVFGRKHYGHLNPPLEGDDKMIRVLMDLAGKIDTLTEAQMEQKAILEAHLAGEQHLLDTVAGLSKGFPGGDADGHRAYHESVIAYMERRDKMMNAIIEKSLAGLVWAALLAVGSAMWAYLQKKLGVG